MMAMNGFYQPDWGYGPSLAHAQERAAQSSPLNQGRGFGQGGGFGGFNPLAGVGAFFGNLRRMGQRGAALLTGRRTPEQQLQDAFANAQVGDGTRGVGTQPQPGTDLLGAGIGLLPQFRPIDTRDALAASRMGQLGGMGNYLRGMGRPSKYGPVR